MSPHRGLLFVGMLLVLAAVAMMPERLAGEAVEVTSSQTPAVHRTSDNSGTRSELHIWRPRG